MWRNQSETEVPSSELSGRDGVLSSFLEETVTLHDDEFDEVILPQNLKTGKGARMRGWRSLPVIRSQEGSENSFKKKKKTHMSS